jgi:hypothetical protein
MRPGAWSIVAGLALALPLEGCSGGYPLPPTRCDEWCDVTRGAQCQDWYNPASCVAQCEEAHLSVPECSDQFDATLACFRRSPNALRQRCFYDTTPDDCSNEVALLSSCSGAPLYY